MVSHGPTFAAFGGESINTYQSTHARDIVGYVKNLPDGKLFDTDEGQLIHEIAANCRLQPPAIQFDQKTHRFVSPNAVAGYRPTGSSMPQQLIEYTLPVKGLVELLQLAPSQGQLLGNGGRPELFIIQGGVDGAVAFYVEDFGDTNVVIQKVNAVLDNLSVNAERLYAELDSYNGSVPSVVRNAITQEKQRREQERNRKDDLLNRLP